MCMRVFIAILKRWQSHRGGTEARAPLPGAQSVVQNSAKRVHQQRFILAHQKSKNFLGKGHSRLFRLFPWCAEGDPSR